MYICMTGQAAIVAKATCDIRQDRPPEAEKTYFVHLYEEPLISFSVASTIHTYLHTYTDLAGEQS